MTQTHDDTLRCPQCKRRTPDEFQYCQHCLYNVHERTFNMISTPPWVGIHSQVVTDPSRMNSATEQKAYDALEAEKTKTLRTSAHWRTWEASRKHAWQRNKPAYLKDVAYKDKKERTDRVKKALGL